VVYIAPDRKHLSISASGTVVLSDPGEKDMYVPSADRLLSSVSSFAKSAAVAVVLTGMGRDGSTGVVAVHREHGWNIAQDEASSIVFGMPSAAIATGCVDAVVPLDKVASEIVDRVAAVSR
jgi:two-component system, chemotaxis family, protein-glutamate methylesterase/glutaminase